jgi:hypothetical protein
VKQPSQKAQTPKLTPEAKALAEAMKEPTPTEMVEAIEAECEGWYDGNTIKHDIQTMDLENIRAVHVLRCAARFIRNTGRRMAQC